VPLCVLCGIFIKPKIYFKMKTIFFLIIIFFCACDNSSEKINEEFKPVDASLTITNGEILFKANCATCHKPTEKFIGPALKGSINRWESKALLYDFVRNSQDVISRNTYAKKLFEEYKQSPMMPYPQLKDEEIQSILDYCENYK
jgi:mono/diheme cytochrome c family protein